MVRSILVGGARVESDARIELVQRSRTAMPGEVYLPRNHEPVFDPSPTPTRHRRAAFAVTGVARGRLARHTATEHRVSTGGATSKTPRALTPNDAHHVIRRFILAIAFGTLGLLSSPVTAQQSSTQMSFDATIGRSFGHGGGDRQNPNGLALDALLSWRSRRPSLFHGTFAFGAGVNGDKSDSSCLPLPGNGCVPDYPRIYTLGIFYGLEHQGRLGLVRLLAGPSHFRIDGGGGALGAQVRLDVASPALHRIALVGSVRQGLVWNLDRQDFQMTAVGIGLGIY